MRSVRYLAWGCYQCWGEEEEEDERRSLVLAGPQSCQSDKDMEPLGCVNLTTSTSQHRTEPTQPAGLNVTFKESFILFLFFLLLLYSVVTFFNNWSKNYRGVNHLPYYNHYLGTHQPLPSGKGRVHHIFLRKNWTSPEVIRSKKALQRKKRKI